MCYNQQLMGGWVDQSTYNCDNVKPKPLTMHLFASRVESEGNWYQTFKTTGIFSKTLTNPQQQV